jgi:hypothetical protein
MVSRAEEYRRYAQECLDAASRLQSEEQWAILIRIADTWRELADQDEKSEAKSDRAQKE